MMGVEPALTNDPLGFPLEPGSEAASMNAAPEEGRAVVRNLRLVGPHRALRKLIVSTGFPTACVSLS